MRYLFFILLLGLGVLFARPHNASATPDTWPRALALMAAGEAQSALPLLEDLVSAHPDNKNYRFELALALFHLEKDFRAKWQLEQVRGANLTAAEAQMVEQVMARIDARSVWSASLNIALRPESNVGQKTSTETVNIGGLDFTLRPDARAKPGVSLLVTASLGYSPQINDNWRGRFSLNTHLRYNEDETLRDYQVIARAGLQHVPDARTSISAGLQQGFRWVSDTPYSKTAGVWAEYSQLLGKRGRLDFGLSLAKTRHVVALPDSRRALVTASYSHAVSNNARLTFSSFYEVKKGNLPNLAGTRKGISISGLYAWRGGLMTSLQLDQHYDNRRGPEPLFGLTRGDEKTALSLTVYHRDLRMGSFAPTLVIGVEKNRSNIPVARYNNRYLTIGLTRNF